MASEGNNPSGNNQFGGFGIDPPYGQEKKNFELLRSAPLSGAPISGRALGTPERQRSARRRAAAGGGRPQGGQGPTTTVLPQLPLTYEKQISLIWRQVAAIPGSSDTAHHLADVAAQAAQNPAPNGPPLPSGPQ